MMLHLDLFSGASGDKLVGALLDVAEQTGAYSLDQLRDDLATVEPRIRVRRERAERCGIAAWHVQMLDADTGRAADDPHAAHRAHDHVHWSQIRPLIEGAPIDERAKRLAVAVFERIAAAEAQVHGTTVDDVAFHEVGALDSIADIVGCALVVAALGGQEPLRVNATPLALGSGTVDCAHGTLPVPAPATALLVQGLPVEAGPVDCELTTPTGAALVAELVDSWGPVPPMVPAAIGMGAGTRELAGVANVLRVIAGKPLAADGSGKAEERELEKGEPELVVEGTVLLTCNIDHLSGEAAARAVARIMDDGALDAWQCPIAMKKGRLGIELNVLCAPVDAERLASLVHTETGTLGLRRQLVERTVTGRSHDVVQTASGPVRFKSMLVSDGEGGFERTWVRAESDDLARLESE